MSVRDWTNERTPIPKCAFCWLLAVRRLRLPSGRPLIPPFTHPRIAAGRRYSTPPLSPLPTSGWHEIATALLALPRSVEAIPGPASAAGSGLGSARAALRRVHHPQSESAGLAGMAFESRGNVHPRPGRICLVHAGPRPPTSSARSTGPSKCSAIRPSILEAPL